jgi:transposase
LAEVDILGPSDRRRIWSAEEKAALLAEIDAEGGKVRLVARRHQISESLLYNWRSARKAAAVALGAPENVEFIPVGVIEDPATRGPTMLVLPTPEPAPRSPSAEGKTGSIEITLPNGSPCQCRCFRQREGVVSGAACDEGARVISLAPGAKVFLACRPVDLRNGFDGLTAKAQQLIGVDPFSGHLFIFRGKRGDYFKGLYWDGTGMWLIANRLEKGRFVWPPIIDGAMMLTPAQFSVLIEAMDWRRTIAPPPPAQPMLV